MRLRELRKQAGLTLDEVSRAINYDISNLSRVERGLQTLTVPLAQQLAALYGVSIDDLVRPGVDKEGVQLTFEFAQDASK